MSLTATIIQIVIAVIGSGGLVTGFIALRKAKPEAENISVRTAEGAVKTLNAVIVQMEKELTRLRKGIEDRDSVIEEKDKQIAGLIKSLQNCEEMLHLRCGRIRKDVDKMKSQNEGKQ